MITFIIWIRCLATLLITNSHYGSIYPIGMLAKGGMIGDILFFAVSGYCLTNLRTGFAKWYAKRLGRIMPAVLFITVIHTLFSRYSLSVYATYTQSTPLFGLCTALGIEYPTWLSWLLYPTNYHFVGSILVLYIPYYLILKHETTRRHLSWVMFGILEIYLALYVFAYDKSIYHINAIQEPFVRFLFMESMLLGAYFKINDAKLRTKGGILRYALCTAGAFIMYISCTLLLQKGILHASLQIFSQLLIFLLLYFVMRSFVCMDSALERAPKWISLAVAFIASITLEIYLVQDWLIGIVRRSELVFPLNWLILTLMIFLFAVALHYTVEGGRYVISCLVQKIKKKTSV